MVGVLFGLSFNWDIFYTIIRFFLRAGGSADVVATPIFRG